ncbi:MAG TPA: hypothetical protein VFZ53_34105 [Polyangiaceae bacterium]
MTSSLARRFHLLLLGGLVALCLLAGACRRQSAPLATLERASGSTERDRRDAVGRWERAAQGATFTVGDGARTGADSRALLRLFDRSALELSARTIVRFLDRASAPKGTALDVEMGEATLEAGDGALEIGLEIGVARLDAGSKVRLVGTNAGTRLEVMIGAAHIHDGERTFELRVGDAVDWVSGGKPVLVPKASDSASPETPPSPLPSSSAGPSDTASDEASLSKLDVAGGRAPGPVFVDLLASAGDSFVVHDPRPPTAVAFSVPACPSGAVLTIESGKKGARETIGSGRVSAEFSQGTHRYSVACLGGGKSLGTPVARGTLSVVADAGLRTLAKTAPSSSVDTDGRRYTVLYQSLLPRLSVRWPNAPAASSYTLSVRSKQGARSFSSASANHTFDSGSLAEGEHSLTFEADGRRSKETSVVIRFDNAAPTASLTSPADTSFAPGSSVLVSGAALPGWSVAVAGRELAQDEQNRFSELVSAPGSERALAIRFSQAGRGVHYYLRRSARQ